MGCEVGDAADCVALDLDVGREHLSDQGFKAAEADDGDLVLGVDGEVPECGRGGALDLDVVGREEKQDRLEGLAGDFADILFGDFGEREGGGPLQVDVVRVGEGREGAEGVAGEEVGILAVLEVLQQVGDGFALVVEQQRLVRLLRRRGWRAGGVGGQSEVSSQGEAHSTHLGSSLRRRPCPLLYGARGVTARRAAASRRRRGGSLRRRRSRRRTRAQGRAKQGRRRSTRGL